MESRIELAIGKLNDVVVTGLRDMQKQLDQQTWLIIGAVCVMMGLTLTLAKVL